MSNLRDHRKGARYKLSHRCGDLSATYFAKTKNQAEQRNLEHNVSIQYLWNLFLQQKAKCKLSGQEITLNPKHGTNPEYRTNSWIAQTASLDRIDSSKGYVEGNVQWVHKTINTMKMDLLEDEFITLCRLLATNYNSSTPIHNNENTIANNC